MKVLQVNYKREISFTVVSIKFLKSHSLFGGVSTKDIERIRPLLKEKSFEPGQDIIVEGETGNSLYFIHRGSVDVLKNVTLDDGTVVQRKIAQLDAGETFGEMEVIDIEPRTATVRAATSVVTFTISGIELYEISGWSPQAFFIIIMNLAREISRRLRKMDAIAAEFLLKKEFGSQIVSQQEDGDDSVPDRAEP